MMRRCTIYRSDVSLESTGSIFGCPGKTGTNSRLRTQGFLAALCSEPGMAELAVEHAFAAQMHTRMRLTRARRSACLGTRGQNYHH